MRFSGLSIRQLEAFDMIMRTGSVTVAARSLNISQPSVSRLIQDLERDCGLLLFDRTKGRLVPTSQATLFHEEVAATFKSARELMAVAQGIKELKYTNLRVGALAAASLELVPSVLRRFRECHEDALTNVSVRSSQHIVSAVTSRKMDIGIIDGGVSIMDAVLVGSYDFPCVCVMGASHPLSSLEMIGLEDLRPYPFISLGTDYMMRSETGRALFEAVRDNIVVEAFQSFIACGFVLDSKAVAVIDPLTARFYSRIGLVSRPLISNIPFTLKVVLNNRSASDLGAKAFTGFLDTHIAAL